MENWRPVVGFSDYEVSDLGRVKRATAACRTRPGHILTPCPMKGKPYMRVSLRCAGKTVTRKVHHLVLEAFIGPRKPGEETRHLNGDGADNRLDNLAWGTKLENGGDKVAHDHSLHSGRHPMSKLSPEVVRAIRASTESARSLALKYGVCAATVSHARSGRRWYRVK